MEPFSLSVTFTAPHDDTSCEDCVSSVTLKERVLDNLSVCARHGYHHLVIGAWGCGKSRGKRSQPQAVSAAFLEALSGNFAGLFQRVIFAIRDVDEHRIFQDTFCQQW